MARPRSVTQRPKRRNRRADTSARPGVDGVADSRLAPAQPASPGELERLFTLLREASGIDFRLYRRPTIDRRVARRMMQRKCDMEEYLRCLEREPAEAQMLAQELLILVTCFFRDPEEFERLRRIALPAIIAAHADGRPIRLWGAGCSTGEEVYSLAMVLLEALGDHAADQPIRIFATDVNQVALVRARTGIYSARAMARVSPARRKRFFVPSDGDYHIRPEVRALCVFARHDLTRDVPYFHLDVIARRNVLMYLDLATQTKILALFARALEPNGILMLGQGESIGRRGGFVPLRPGCRIYVKDEPSPVPRDTAKGAARARGDVRRRARR